ncbi:phage holin family protein [Pseudomethylobacillus aquaticus]|uniref:Phage holin family protein n=1 Tax=Pseudomethylobacillus aquaticus TaxID=2676064 RepID=A0A3N0V648_9PROT|nr:MULTISPECIES: phage holin family protein [Methylophilaceae]ROH88183.1 phage holin family protein [Pseudomethylobacillus aquaticus]
MSASVMDFLLHWGIMSFSLWVASRLFKGLTFDSGPALLVSALLLGFVNAVLRPLLLLLTFPLTLLSFGLFALVINALMLMLVAALVSGCRVSGFWTAFFVSIFIAVFSFVIELLLPSQGVAIIPAANTIMI